MTPDELNQLKELILKAQSVVNQEEEQKWPQEGDDVFRLLSNGVIVKEHWGDKNYLHDDLTQGGIFRTEAAAERKRDQNALLTKLWRESTFKPNWSDASQTKYYPIFDHQWVDWRVEFDWSAQNNFVFPYYQTKAECQAMMESNDLSIFLGGRNE